MVLNCPILLRRHWLRPSPVSTCQKYRPCDCNKSSYLLLLMSQMVSNMLLMVPIKCHWPLCLIRRQHTSITTWHGPVHSTSKLIDYSRHLWWLRMSLGVKWKSMGCLLTQSQMCCRMESKTGLSTCGIDRICLQHHNGNQIDSLLHYYNYIYFVAWKHWLWGFCWSFDANYTIKKDRLPAFCCRQICLIIITLNSKKMLL